MYIHTSSAASSSLSSGYLTLFIGRRGASSANRSAPPTGGKKRGLLFYFFVFNAKCLDGSPHNGLSIEYANICVFVFFCVAHIETMRSVESIIHL